MTPWTSQPPSLARRPPARAVAPLLLLLLVGVLSGCTPSAPASTQKPLVRFATVRAFSPEQGGPRPSYIAVLRGDEETELSFKVGGILELIGPGNDGSDWREGVEVPPGALLARLKQADFVHAVESARARAELAGKVHERGRTLVGQGAISKQEFEVMEAEKASAEANLAQREQDLHDSTLVAPYQGSILARLVHAGETVAPGRTVLRFASLDQMSAELGVPDKVINRIHVNQEIPLSVSGYENQPVAGRVSEVGVAAKDGSRLFKVVLKVNNLQRLLKSGMTASVSFADPEGTSPQTVLVPLSALVAGPGGGLSVYVVGEDGRAHTRPVVTDEIVRSEVQVTEGLQAGERVVVVGVGQIFDGAAVEALPAERL